MKGYEKALVIHKNGKMKIMEVGIGRSCFDLPDYYFSPEQFDGDIESLLADVYDPKKNKFKIVKSGQPIERLKEVWMSGNCLFVHDKDIVDIK